MDKRLAIVGDKKYGDEALRLRLVSFMNENPHLTSLVLSRYDHIGKSRTTLDDYVAGILFLPVSAGGKGVNPKSSKTESAIRAYLDRVQGSAVGDYVRTFVETKSWQKLLSAWEAAIAEKIIVVVYGKPGIGKSECLMQLAVKKMTTRPISIVCSPNITVRYFIQRIAQELGISDRHVIPQLEDMVAEKLRKNPRPLIVDQANYLNEKSLGTVCYLWEQAKHIPIVLVGTTELFNLFHTSSLTEDVRAQLASRVALHYPLPELSLPETKAILKRALGDVSDEILAEMHNATGGIFRSLDFIVPNINRLKKEKRVADALKSGETTMAKVVTEAGRRLIA